MRDNIDHDILTVIGLTLRECSWLKSLTDSEKWDLRVRFHQMILQVSVAKVEGRKYFLLKERSPNYYEYLLDYCLRVITCEFINCVDREGCFMTTLKLPEILPWEGFQGEVLETVKEACRRNKVEEDSTYYEELVKKTKEKYKTK